MFNDRHPQLVAALSALHCINALPAGTIWSLTVTNDDDTESPTVLNIFAPERDWMHLQSLLDLKTPSDRSTHEIGEQFITYRKGALHISLIEHEETT